MVKIKAQKTESIYGGYFSRTVLIKDWPNQVIRGFTYPFNHLHLGEGIHIKITYVVGPAKIKWNLWMEWKEKRIRANVEAEAGRPGGMPRPEEVKALQAIEHLKRSTAYSGSEVSDLWCFITVTADTRKSLNNAVKKLIHELKTKMQIKKVVQLKKRQHRAFANTLILNNGSNDIIKEYPGRLMDEEAVTAFYPFLNGSITDNRGIYFGHRVADLSVVLQDLTAGEGNKNITVLGASGEGKSTFLKSLCNSAAGDNWKVVIYDVDGEFYEWCQEVGGLWVDLSSHTGRYQDPVKIAKRIGDPREDDARYANAAARTAKLISILAGGLTTEELNALDRALMKCWEDVGIVRDDPSTWENKGASIHTWYAFLKGDQSPEARSLAAKVWRYFEGIHSNMFSHEEEIDFDNEQIIVFHIAQAVNNQADTLTGLAKLTMALDMGIEHSRRERLKGENWSLYVFDEGQRQTKIDLISDVINFFATTVRKYNGVACCATNKTNVLWPETGGSDGGKGLWENSSIKILFWMEESAMNEVAKRADIPKVVFDKLKTLHETKQFIIRTDKGYDVLKLYLPPEELKLYRTRGLKKGN